MYPRPALGSLVLLLIAIATPRTAPAHDFWIEPSSFHPDVASSVRLMLRVGDSFSGSPVVRRQDRIERFVLAGPNGEHPIAGIEARDPAGFARIDAPGSYVAGYQSRRSSITLPGPRFEKYLAAEGLDAVLEARRRGGQSEAAGQEVFSRCAKTVLRAADSGAPAPRIAPIGCPFELVLETEPSVATADRTIMIRALYLGEPLQGVKISALTRAPNGQLLEAKSDAEGRAAFAIDSAGPWLVKAVHMVAAPQDIDADWESFWASVTFEVPTRLDH